MKIMRPLQVNPNNPAQFYLEGGFQGRVGVSVMGWRGAQRTWRLLQINIVNLLYIWAAYREITCQQNKKSMRAWSEACQKTMLCFSTKTSLHTWFKISHFSWKVFFNFVILIFLGFEYSVYLFFWSQDKQSNWIF